MRPADFRDKRLAAIMLGALVLRVAVAAWPVLGYPDELWQYLEPARHIVAGRWVETWDFRDGLRSWLLPTMLSAPMALGYAIAPLTRLDVFFARLLCVALSMLGVVAGIEMGWRLSRWHGLVVGVATAGWFELAYLGPRTSAEPVATNLALIAVPLLSSRGTMRTAISGFLLGLACAIRVQYLPALGVLALGTIGLDWRRWLLVAAGVSGALASSAAADAAMSAVPFQWVWRNVSINLVQGKAATFGVQPFWWYGTEAWSLYGPGILLIVLFAIVGAMRYPVLFCSAVVNLLVHSLIAHKEYRFVFYTTGVMVLLAAIGSVDLWSRYVRRAGSGTGWSRSPALLGMGWLLWSGSSAAFGAAASTWGVNGRMIAAWKVAGGVSDVCGMAVYGIQDMPVASYALFGRNVSIYQYDATEGLAGRRSRAFNVALTRREIGSELDAFSLVACDRLNYFCVYRRPGGCTETEADRYHEENRFLVRQGR